MSRITRALLVSLALLLPQLASAQQTPLAARAGTPHYDVVLEVPELSVGELTILVANLRAHLSLQAHAARLVNISAGAVVSVDSVQIGLYGVLAEAYLYVDLDNVTEITRRVVATLDRNPQILTRLLQSADSLLRVTGGVANTLLQPGGVVSQTVGAVGQTLDNVTQPGGLLSQTVNAAGQTVQMLVSQTGSILERTLGATGNLVNERTLGSVLNLTRVSEVTNAAGQTVRTVRDTAGNVIEVTLNTAGQVVGTRVLQTVRR
jgi:YD repeat-containing protein